LTLVAGDLLDHSVELGAGQGPLKWLGDRAVVLAGIYDVPTEPGQARELVGYLGLDLQDREADLRNVPGTKWAAVTEVVDHADRIPSVTDGTSRFARADDDTAGKTAPELITAVWGAPGGGAASIASRVPATGVARCHPTLVDVAQSVAARRMN
jgi:hypothetical protein